MSSYITNLYRNIVPKNFRDFIYKLFLKKVLTFFRSCPSYIKGKFYYLLSFFSSLSDEKHKAWAFIGKYGKTQYPGINSSKYNETYDIHIDRDNNLPYIIHSGKRLYFPRKSNNEILNIYKSLLLEQDDNSAHQYVKSHDVFKNKILLDIGAAEGIIALEAIEIVDFVYLFECDEIWIEALNETFKPWKSKVEIVKKYVSDKDEDNYISLDTFMKNKTIDNLFLKMDIEGAELDALKGASYILDNAKGLDFSICTYHSERDQIEIPEFIKKHGYDYRFTKGYLYIDWHLRKGIIKSC